MSAPQPSWEPPRSRHCVLFTLQPQPSAWYSGGFSCVCQLPLCRPHTSNNGCQVSGQCRTHGSSSVKCSCLYLYFIDPLTSIPLSFIKMTKFKPLNWWLCKKMNVHLFKKSFYRTYLIIFHITLIKTPPGTHILQMGKQRLREVQPLTQGHAARSHETGIRSQGV